MVHWILPLLLLLVVGIVLSAFLRMLWRWRNNHHKRKRGTRIHRGFCPACAYDFAGQFNPACPECGYTLTDREQKVLRNISPVLKRTRMN